LPGPAERCIDRIHAVCCTDHDHLPAFLEPVHHGEELGHDPALDFPGHFLAPGCDGIEFVDKDDRRGILPRLFKDLAEPLLALSVIFRDDLGAGNRDEVRPALACHRLCNQGLARAGRAIEEHALGWLDPKFLEELRVPEREFDRLAEPLELVL